MYYSYFYDNHPLSFPKDTQHFFNILVICIAVPKEDAEEIFPDGVTEIWYLDELTTPRPKAIHFYLDEDYEEYLFDDEDEWEEQQEEEDWEDEDEEEDTYFEDTIQIDVFPHSVVEIYNRNQVCFYSMIDFYTPGTWEITYDY